MTTGVACATLPTSSSACMMRLMRAMGNLDPVALRFTMVVASLRRVAPPGTRPRDD